MRVCRLCRRYAKGGAERCAFDGGALLEGPVPPVAPHDEVGGYVVKRAVAAGQTGVVLLCERLGQTGARAELEESAEPDGERQSGELLVKILNPAPADEVDARRAILDSAAALSMEGLHPIEEVFEHEGRLCVAQTPMQGETLAAFLPRNGPLDPAEAVALGRRLCDVLAIVHEAGLSHLDVRPGHLFIPEGKKPSEAILFDLGAPSPPGSNAAPERFDGKNHPVKTDVYGVCATLYVALAGRSAFRADAPDELSWLVHNAPPPPLRVIRTVGNVDPLLEQLIIHGMAKNPSARPDLETLSKALDAIAAEDIDLVERLLEKIAATAERAAERGPSESSAPMPDTPRRGQTAPRTQRPLLLEDDNPTMRFVRKILPRSMLGPTGLTQGFFLEGDQMEREVARAEWEEAQARRENVAAWFRLITLLLIALILGGVTVWALTN